MTSRTPTVVVGIDRSAHAARAAEVGAQVAARRGWPVRLIMVFDWTEDPLPGLPDTLAARADARRSANLDLEHARRDLSSLLPAWTITTALVDGRPGTALVRAVEPGDLLVVGASGMNWGTAGVLGCTAEAVAAAAPCPVLVHRDPNPLDRKVHAVVVGVRGGQGSEQVLATAALEAADRGVPLRLVHGWRQLTDDAPASLQWRMDDELGASTETAAIAPVLAALRRTHPGVTVSVDVEKARAGRLLVRRSQGADLLVVGRRAPEDGGPGATVHAVLHQARLPVLVVPLTAAPPSPPPRSAHPAAAGVR